MATPFQLSASASSSASSGPSKSGDISGGTAFNIGGINLGTQYPTAATAGGGVSTSPLSAALGGNGVWIAGGIGVAVIIGVLVWKFARK